MSFNGASPDCLAGSAARTRSGRVGGRRRITHGLPVVGFLGKSCDVLAECEDIRVSGAEDVPFDVEHLAEGAEGAGLIAAGLVEGGKVVLDDSNLVVMLSVPTLPDGQRTCEGSLSLGVALLSEKQGAE